MLTAASMKPPRAERRRAASGKAPPRAAAPRKTPPPIEEEVDRLVSWPEAARLLGTTERWLDACSKRGDIEVVWLSARRRALRVSVINRFIKSRSA